MLKHSSVLRSFLWLNHIPCANTLLAIANILLYSLASSWNSGLFLFGSYCEPCHCEHLNVSLGVGCDSSSLGSVPKSKWLSPLSLLFPTPSWAQSWGS